MAKKSPSLVKDLNTYRFKKLSKTLTGETQRNPHTGASQSDFRKLTKKKVLNAAREKWSFTYRGTIRMTDFASEITEDRTGFLEMTPKAWLIKKL